MLPALFREKLEHLLVLGEGLLDGPRCEKTMNRMAVVLLVGARVGLNILVYGEHIGRADIHWRLNCGVGQKASTPLADRMRRRIQRKEGLVIRWEELGRSNAEKLLRNIDPLGYDGFYQAAVGQLEICKANLAVAIKAYKNPQEKMDKPHTSIYAEDDVVLDVENVLICHVSGFFPPPVRVSWTKNNEILTGDSLSQYRPKDDGTYNIFSSLTFTPEEGDIYSCTVNHVALDEPQTKTWEVDVAVPGVGPAVFCGVGLSLGLLGVAAGTFFLIKGNNCN